ncbi:hypothetical protein M758_1G230800 [Ceratodon purpureus]|nr:hypothetical protein M758_1G230800 [Ceratodon purpureus]
MRAAATCVGMNKKTIRRAIQRRALLNQSSDGEVWARLYRRKRKDAFDQCIVDQVVAWWTDETRVSPCKKDVRVKRVAFKTKITHATHWLEESELDFYTRFRAANRDLSLSYTVFKRLKPFYVKRLTDFNSCCCKYHQEMQEITLGFQNMRTNKVHIEAGESGCTCGCASICTNFGESTMGEGPVTCQVSRHRYKRSSELWEQSLCPRLQGSEWHAKSCLKGECSECGFRLIPLCEREVDPENKSTMTWRCFEMVSAGSKTKKGDPKQVIRLEYKVTIPREFLLYAEPKIKQFVWHQFVARWQDTKFKQSVQDLKPGEVLSLIDFAENYSYKGQSEIQSQHWFSFQCTILVHITYRINDSHNPEDPQSKRLSTEYHYYISDDRVHDSLFVQHCLMLHWSALVAAGKIPSRHIVWSDGCASQFKGAKAFFFVAKYPSLTVSDNLPTGCKLDWNYWGTGHGKGPHDGAGACVKRALRKEQLKEDSVKLHNATDVVSFLRVEMNLPHAAYPNAKQHVVRHFHLIGLSEVPRDKPLACQTVPGSRSLHSIRSVSHTNNVLLECRDFCCFCSACGRGESGVCANAAHVRPWELVTLQPLSSDDAVQESEDPDPSWIVETGDNILAAECQVGDHFAIVADPNNLDEPGEEFYVLQCTKSMYVHRGPSTRDAWNTVIDDGDEVLEGYYYRHRGRRPNSFVFLREAGVARVYSHLVCATKFTMTQAPHRQKGNETVFQLSDSTLEHIEEVLMRRREHEDLATEEDEEHDDVDSSDDSESDFDE